MKYLTLATILLLLGCSKSDAGYDPIEGFYSLETIVCYCLPVELAPNEQQWHIDLDNGTMEVMSEATEMYQILATGSYELSITPDGATTHTGKVDLLKVAHYQFAILQSGDTLHLSTDTDGNIADAPEYIFVKN